MNIWHTINLLPEQQKTKRTLRTKNEILFRGRFLIFKFYFFRRSKFFVLTQKTQK